MPYLMAAGGFLFSDRELFVVGVASLLLALALALLVNSVRLNFGWIAGLVAIVVLIAEGAVIQATTFRSGDPMVAALIAMAFLAFTHGVNSTRLARRSIWTWPFAGALLGATTLFQPATSFWLVLLLGIWLAHSAYHLIRRKSWGIPVEAFALFWIGVVVVAAPWWVLNWKVAGELKPLGYFVGINLAGAYCDGALAGSGNLDVAFAIGVVEVFRLFTVSAAASSGASG